MRTLKELKLGRYPPAVVAHTNTSILEVTKGLAKKWVRHAPIINEKTGQLVGMISARDIIDFLGGGPKKKIVDKKYNGNLYEAITKESVFSIRYMPPYVTLEDTLYDVVDLMIDRNIGALAVTDNEGKLVGIISERHIMNLFSDVKTHVRVCEIMSRPLITLPPQASILEGQTLMHKKHIRRIVLKSRTGLRGIVSIKDIIKYYANPDTIERLKVLGKKAVYPTPLSYIATRNVITVAPEIDLGDAIKIMRKHNIGSLVVKDRGEYIGIITERDFILKLPKLWDVDIFVDEVQKLLVAGRIVMLR